jgi:hypothetical protein
VTDFFNRHVFISCEAQMKIRKTVRLLAALSAVFLALTVSKAAYSQDGTAWQEYSTQGNPKAAGHNFTLKYPSYYIMPTDFPETDFLQTFVPKEDEEDSGDSFFYMTVAIKDLPDGADLSSLKTDGYWNSRELDRFWVSLAEEIPGVKALLRGVSFENLPMAKISTSTISDDIVNLKAILFVLHGDKLVKLECGEGAFGADPEYGDQDYAKKPACVTYFNSLTFTELP